MSVVVVMRIVVVRIGKPKPRVQWYSLDGKVSSSPNKGISDHTVEEYFETNDDDKEITIKKLVINQLNRSHANSTYTCLAGNDDNPLESNLRMTVLINMYCEYKVVSFT